MVLSKQTHQNCYTEKPRIGTREFQIISHVFLFNFEIRFLRGKDNCLFFGLSTCNYNKIKRLFYIYIYIHSHIVPFSILHNVLSLYLMQLSAFCVFIFIWFVIISCNLLMAFIEKKQNLSRILVSLRFESHCQMKKYYVINCLKNIKPYFLHSWLERIHTQSNMKKNWKNDLFT